MNKLFKLLRITYSQTLGGLRLPELEYEKNPDKASEMIFNLLTSNKPCMIARFGATELTTMVNYLGVKQGRPKSITKYIKGEYLDWWWYTNMMQQMEQWSGFFPPTESNISRFCEMMIEDAKEVDILGSWLPQEYYFRKEIKNAQKIYLPWLEPWHSKNPWTRCLKGKKVLVIHPFAKTITSQYRERDLLFKDKRILPEFELQVIPAVQSLGGNNIKRFKDWFEALKWMESEIDKCIFDYALIGCGAYGLPLAAYIKRSGGKAIHWGGSLQLLFGIWGNRWNDRLAWNEVGVREGFYLDLKNEAWTSPDNEFKPENAPEDGCYW